MTSEDFGGQAEDANEDNNGDEDTISTFAEFKETLLQDLENFENEISNNPDDYPDMDLSDWFQNFAVFAGWI